MRRWQRLQLSTFIIAYRLYKTLALDHRTRQHLEPS